MKVKFEWKGSVNLKYLFKTWLYLIIIGAIVIYGWQGLELLIIGKINPNKVDTIIAWILIVSLYGNVKTLEKILHKK